MIAVLGVHIFSSTRDHFRKSRKDWSADWNILNILRLIQPVHSEVICHEILSLRNQGWCCKIWIGQYPIVVEWAYSHLRTSTKSQDKLPCYTLIWDNTSQKYNRRAITWSKHFASAVTRVHFPSSSQGLRYFFWIIKEHL